MINTASTLERLPCGQYAFIKGVDVEGDLRTRLTALGLETGKEVQVLRRASLGGPLHVRVGTTEIILRRNEAASIQISSSLALAA
jgi:ferrous iron transport protein A